MTRPTYVELYGIHRDSAGRRCDRHACCGALLEVNNVVRLKKCVMLLNGKLQHTIKGVALEGGDETCTVGYTPGFYTDTYINNLDGKLCQIKELFYNSDNRSKVADDRRNGGIAAGYVIE
jgi:hypothetical protein